MGSAQGAKKIAAKRIGVTLEHYEWRLRRGHRWCSGCSRWRLRKSFGRDSSRGDGLAKSCRDCQAARGKARYVPKERKRGRRYVAARNGDKEQARGRVNHLARIGVIPKPSDLRCVDCGGRAAEYDHHLGYSAENHESVEAVCSKCHSGRDCPKKAQTHCVKGHEFNEENTGRAKSGTRFCYECRRAYDRGRRDAAYWRRYRAERKSRESV